MYSDWKESFTVDVRAVWVMVTFFLLIIFKFYLNFTFYNTIHVLHMRLFTTMVLLATIKSVDAISKVANLWLFATNNARRLSFFNRSNRKNDVCRCRMVFTRRLNSNWPTTILSNFLFLFDIKCHQCIHYLQRTNCIYFEVLLSQLYHFL